MPPIAIAHSAQPALAKLRRATRRQHDRLHGHPLLAPLLAGSICADDYVRVLAAFYGFYAGLEPRLVAAAAGCGCATMYSQAIRVAWLAEDLAALGFNSAAVARLPFCRDLPEPNGLSEFAGCLYVVEGSALGGRQIAQRLSRSVSSVRFFSGRGDATPARWSDVCRFLETALDSPTHRTAAARRASQVFGALESWLNRVANRSRRVP